MKNAFETAGYTVEKITSKELNDQKIREIADLFRMIFCNAYGQYLLYPSSGTPISPQEIFKKNDFIPLEALDALPLPRSDENGEQAIFWHDPEITFKRFQEKFRHQAHLVLVRRDQQLVGMTFGYECALEEAFHSEEWENPHHYSRLRSEAFLRDFAEFIEAFRKVAADHREVMDYIMPNTIDAKSQVYVWNCVILAIELQGKGFGPELIRIFFDWIRSHQQPNRLQIGEVIPDSPFHRLLKAAGAIDVPGALGSSRILLEMSSLSKLAEFFWKRKD